ncbi:GatB/YqeY domain-containing protein [Gaiella sp.]|uniref:GatB/YqeY domain-containing protein n=1 Tax=Gaiella sp. TaxID=2663207 RepID=UPI002E31AF01|nr:GatB/YqeY domain-containing protein [Gaiella sp.]HEX5583974.1 GatB/YqeY domain-containing protein [Gaiella sp.]
MTLIADIENELKEARLARDVERRDALALLLNALRGAQKELRRELSEDESLQVLQRERKKRAEAMEAYDAAGREEQADREEYELDVIEEFMPDPLSDDDLEEIVDNVIAEVGATSLHDLGRVMADVMPQVSGRADGSTVSQLVREKLA